MPASRARSGHLKQTTLPFFSKRSASTANINSKTKSDTSTAVVSDTSSSSDEDEIEEFLPDELAKASAVAKSKEIATKKKGEQNAPFVGGSSNRLELHIGDKKWNNVWNEARSKMDNLQPIHGEEENKFHQILRVFDMSYEYGPCVGVSRLERWERASALGLNPPVEIRDILLSRQGIEDVSLSENVLHDYQL